MADVHYFLKIDGIDGQSKDDKHAKEIELLGFFFRESQKSESGQVSGKVKMDDLVVRMQTSKASPNLFLACANGTRSKNAVLTCNQATGSGGQDWYLKWTMEGVAITEFKHVAAAEEVELTPIQGVSHAAIVPLEEISLSYSSLKMEFRPKKDDGSFDAAVTGCWNRDTNKAC